MRKSPLPRMIVAAGLALLAIALTALNGACDSEPQQSAETEATRLDAMIGQMIMVGFDGRSEHDPGVMAVRDELAKGTIGGVVLYPENIGRPEELSALTAFLRNAKTSPVPFIAIDQEGGLVQRLTRQNGHTYFPSARSVGSNPSFASPEAAERLYTTMAEEEAKAGFNLNFGPVIDLSLNPHNFVIVQQERSFGADPATVAALAGAFIRAHRAAGVVTVAKHFPGHGSSSADSHKTLPDISESWKEVELEPYRALAKDGLLDAVMLGHLYHPRFSDGAKLPASLSVRAVDALRDKDQVGFQGVVVSDDMEMGAVADAYSIEERVVKAVNAGTDLVVFSNVSLHDPALGTKLHGIIADAVHDGRIPQSRIEKAYGKLLLLKRRVVERDLAGRW